MPVERNVRLAEETQSLLKKRRLSLRGAEMESGVGYNTILGMKDGKSPGYEHILRFARAFGENPLHWLEIAGFTDILELVAPSDQGSEVDENAARRNELLIALSGEIGTLPQEAQRAYGVAIRAFTTAWVAGWHTLQEEQNGP